MSFSLEVVDTSILNLLRTTVFPGQSVIEQAVVDSTTLVRGPNGVIKPYIAYSTGDLMPIGPRSFAGPGGDSYRLPIHLKIVVPGDGVKTGKKLYWRALQYFLASDHPWASEVRKTVGGSQIPIKKSDGSIEAIVFPAGFSVNVQLSDSA